MKRHHVWALYAFCRYADDIVDDLGPATVDRARGGAAPLRRPAFADLEAGRCDDPVLKAVVHTVRAFDIDPDCFRRFLRSMAMDLTVADYATYDDLLGYMDGSAAVIGEMMLPILEPRPPPPSPRPRPRRRRSSSPTSCATWPRTSTAAGCTCPRRTSTASGPIRGGGVDDAVASS